MQDASDESIPIHDSVKNHVFTVREAAKFRGKLVAFAAKGRIFSKQLTGLI